MDKCPDCLNIISSTDGTCRYCGYKLPYNQITRRTYPTSQSVSTSSELPKLKEEDVDYSVFKLADKYKQFNGIWRYDKKGNRKSEVICPRCGSWECGFYQQEQTKTQYKANLNPFKPFTYVNKKESTKILERYICNSCGKVFD